MRISHELTLQNENTWIRLGKLSESLNSDKTISYYENAIRINPYSEPALFAIASFFRQKENYPTAAEYLQRIITINPNHGNSWGSLGHCYLMMDDLQKAYSAYQQALYLLKNPQDPLLWYGIGILYDRYGSFDHAEEAFAAVLRMNPHFEKYNEIYFRLGIIYKQKSKLDVSLDCFRFIINHPPHPLNRLDIMFQIGHVYELQKDYSLSKLTYEQVLNENPNHAKVLQQLGWLYQDSKTNFTDSDMAINLLTKSIDADPKDSQSWYLLGRCYMYLSKFSEAYESYQQAVYRDGRNPTFWCSIGVLYYQINQYNDALDAYGRAIRLNPYISEVWYDLGTLYESCNNQLNDAIDAYTRALELDSGNTQIANRILRLKEKAKEAESNAETNRTNSDATQRRNSLKDLAPIQTITRQIESDKMSRIQAQLSHPSNREDQSPTVSNAPQTFHSNNITLPSFVYKNAGAKEPQDNSKSITETAPPLTHTIPTTVSNPGPIYVNAPIPSNLNVSEVNSMPKPTSKLVHSNAPIPSNLDPSTGNYKLNANSTLIPSPQTNHDITSSEVALVKSETLNSNSKEVKENNN